MSVLASIEPLLWESEFFARPIAQLNFLPQATTLQHTDYAPYELLQAKVAAADISLVAALLADGFQFVEGEIGFSLAINTSHHRQQMQQKHTQWRSVSADSTHISLLRSLAADLFIVSRFRAPWYAATEGQRLYAEWIEKAVLGTFDHHCILLMDQGEQPMGFVTLRHQAKHTARIGLLGVAPSCTGQGIGGYLLALAEEWCLQQQIKTLFIATQSANLAALKLYSRYGASIDSTHYWLYRGK